MKVHPSQKVVDFLQTVYSKSIESNRKSKFFFFYNGCPPKAFSSDLRPDYLNVPFFVTIDSTLQLCLWRYKNTQPEAVTMQKKIFGRCPSDSGWHLLRRGWLSSWQWRAHIYPCLLFDDSVSKQKQKQISSRTNSHTQFRIRPKFSSLPSKLRLGLILTKCTERSVRVTIDTLTFV